MKTKTKIIIGVAVLILILSLVGGGYEYKKERSLRISTQSQLKTAHQSLSKTAKTLAEAIATSESFSNEEVVRNADGSVFLDGQGKPVILKSSGNKSASRSSSDSSSSSASAFSSSSLNSSTDKEEHEIEIRRGVKKWNVLYAQEIFGTKGYLGAGFRQKVFMFEMSAGAMVPVVPLADPRGTMAVLQVSF